MDFTNILLSALPVATKNDEELGQILCKIRGFPSLLSGVVVISIFAIFFFERQPEGLLDYFRVLLCNRGGDCKLEACIEEKEILGGGDM